MIFRICTCHIEHVLSHERKVCIYGICSVTVVSILIMFGKNLRCTALAIATN